MRFFFSKKEFDKAARDYVFSRQSKPQGFDKMTWAFTDSKGKNYYKYLDPMDMPLRRKGVLDRLVRLLSAGLDKNEIDFFTESMDKAVEECINTMTMDGRTKGLGKITLITEEMRRRKDNIVHENLYFSLIGASYIREDQNPAEWDDALEDEKIAQFKEDSKGGLYDFFMQSPLSQHIAFFDMSEDELIQLMKESTQRAEAWKNYQNMLFTAAKS